MSKIETKFNTTRFYASDPAASELRDICIRFIRCSKELSELEQGIDRTIKESQLESIFDDLVDAGITPNMHVGRDGQFYRSSPLATAQYCAGQLLTLTSEEADNSSLERAFFRIDDTGSYSVEQDEVAVLKPTKPAHNRVLNLMTPFTILSTIVDFLDAREDIKKA